jgi:hypothetical protein
VSEAPTAAAVPGVAWLTSRQKWGLAAFAVVVLAFGGLVELRSAFLSRRMGDLSVFVRTAWAIRAGHDIYTITDENGFHYHYPPLLAILMTPLADPPPGADHSGMLPYPVTVALWYVFNLLCLTVAVHWLARVLEEGSADAAVRSQPAGCRRWWALRMLPVLACLPPIGHTLMRGQVNLLLLLLLAGMAAAMLRGQPWRAGLWLAGAICLKVIPALLLLVPLCRRDWRCLAGCAVGLVVGLGVIPAAVLGPTRTRDYYKEWANVLVRPGLGAGGDSSARDKELLEVTATDSQSFQAALHNLLHRNRDTRPPQPSAKVRRAHWAIAGLLTAVTLLVLWRRRGDRPAEMTGLGALVVVMALTSPVCHLHYLALAVPLVMGTLAASWERAGTDRVGPGLLTVGVLNLLANVLPNLPGMQAVRDGGLATAGALLLWGAGLAVVWRTARVLPAVPQRRAA